MITIEKSNRQYFAIIPVVILLFIVAGIVKGYIWNTELAQNYTEKPSLAVQLLLAITRLIPFTFLWLYIGRFLNQKIASYAALGTHVFIASFFLLANIHVNQTLRFIILYDFIHFLPFLIFFIIAFKDQRIFLSFVIFLTIIGLSKFNVGINTFSDILENIFSDRWLRWDNGQRSTPYLQFILPSLPNIIFMILTIELYLLGISKQKPALYFQRIDIDSTPGFGALISLFTLRLILLISIVGLIMHFPEYQYYASYNKYEWLFNLFTIPVLCIVAVVYRKILLEFFLSRNNYPAFIYMFSFVPFLGGLLLVGLAIFKSKNTPEETQHLFREPPFNPSPQVLRMLFTILQLLGASIVGYKLLHTHNEGMLLVLLIGTVLFILAIFYHQLAYFLYAFHIAVLLYVLVFRLGLKPSVIENNAFLLVHTIALFGLFHTDRFVLYYHNEEATSTVSETGSEGLSDY